MRSPRSILAVFVVGHLFVAPSAWAVDPGSHVSQYGHTAWRIREGAIGGVPDVVTQTSDGFLWIGTQAGLVRFDGVRFTPWTPPAGQRLPSTVITSLLAARDGSLWIGTQAGLSRWRDDQLTNYSAITEAVMSIVEDRRGTIWIARTGWSPTSRPLCEVSAAVRCYGEAEGVPPSNANSLAIDAIGNVWIGADTTLARWSPGSSAVFRPAALASNAGLIGVSSLAAAADGSLWVGATVPGSGGGLQRIKGGRLQPLVTPELNTSSLAVQALFIDSHRSVWVGTFHQGIYRIHDGTVDHFRSTDGLTSDSVWSFFEDHEGNLWVATEAGLDSFRDLRVISYSAREGIGTGEVDTVLAAHDGTIWVGGAAALTALGRDRSPTVVAGKALPGNQITSVFEDHAGRLWIGADNTLSIYESGRFTRVERPDGRPMGLIGAITEDVDHDIWVASRGTVRTLMRIRDLHVRDEFPAPQMPAARQLAADPGGGIWLGLFDGNLARLHHGTVETMHFSNGSDSRINELAIARDGAVLGATPHGVVAWSHGRQLTLTTRNGLPCESVNGLVFDDRGSLWLYMQCGLVEIGDADIQRWRSDGAATVTCRVLDVLDGVQPGFAPLQSSARGADGRLWFANGLVLQMFDPGHSPGNAMAPPVHIDAVIAGGAHYAPRQDLRVPPLTRDLEIDYTAPSFVAPQKVRFRYRLDGRDAGWQEAGARRQAFYTDLRPGAYRFRVIASNSDGVWNEEGASLAFNVAPAWYQTRAFLFLTIASTLLALSAFYQLRVRHIARSMRAQFDERLAERTRIARELHDTFLQTIQGSKMVADDALEQSEDPVHVKRALEQLSDWLGRAVQEGRAALNSLRTSTTQANDLAEAFRRATEQELKPGSMSITFAAVGPAKHMHPIVRDEIYRIGYEAIRNACTHSMGTRLDVELRYEKDLTVRVSDDGVGIDPGIARDGKDGHFGLQGMRERAARIGGRLTLVSSSSGTDVTLVVPGSIAFRNLQKNSGSLP
jgi:signal transduction histidine kinase/ligand-binding sensor domain-containing protein